MTTLYRFYGADDALLYVGVTGTGLPRVRAHASKAHWWQHVARATFDHGRTLDDERTAIELERPLFNVEHTERSSWLDTVDDALANGWLTDSALLSREMDNLCRLRDQLDARRHEVGRRMDLIIEAGRANRRAAGRQQDG